MQLKNKNFDLNKKINLHGIANRSNGPDIANFAHENTSQTLDDRPIDRSIDQSSFTDSL